VAAVSLSVVIITFNEERNIERCLLSVKEIADEIVVLDSFSTDRTEEIFSAQIRRTHSTEESRHHFRLASVRFISGCG
jgi:glycosyltransferase involved in cell wall biosynthesis